MLDKYKEKVEDLTGTYTTLNLSNLIKENWGKLIGHVVAVIVVFVAGWVGCSYFGQNVVEVPSTVVERVEVPIQVPVEVKGDTQIQYVEKTSTTDADIEMTQSTPQVVMKYNDQEYKFDTVAGETQKFDKGKLQVEQTAKTTLDVTPIVQREVAIERQTITSELNKQFADDKKKTDREHKFETARYTAYGILAGYVLHGVKD